VTPGLVSLRILAPEGYEHFRYIVLLASACEIAGQVEEALAPLDDALQIAERTGERWFASD
jgi:predicted ATPase